jgi:spermidine/putrescine-binding protein
MLSEESMKMYTKVFTLICAVFSASTQAEESVNIITWWGYLNYPELLSPIEKKCGAKISFDEYYTDLEFAGRTKKVDYDIAIHCSATQQTYIRSVASQSLDLASSVKTEYHPSLIKDYEASDYPPNTVYFELSTVGFLFNPKVVDLKATDSIEEIFIKARGKTVVLPDEPAEVLTLLSHTKYQHKKTIAGNLQIPSTEGLMELTKDITIINAVNLAEIFKKPDFAFAYTWSGEAIERIINGDPNLKFMIHPKLSHWTADMITLLTPNKAADCVARELSSRRFLDTLSSQYSYYFSPYLDPNQNAEPIYKHFQSDFVQKFSALPGSPRVTEAEYAELTNEWQKLKLVLSAKD